MRLAINDPFEPCHVLLPLLTIQAGPRIGLMVGAVDHNLQRQIQLHTTFNLAHAHFYCSQDGNLAFTLLVLENFLT